MSSPLEIMKERRKTKHNELTVLLDNPKGENRNLHASEQRSFDRLVADLAEIDVRIGELEEHEKRCAASDESYRMTGAAHADVEQFRRNSGWSVSGEPGIYSDPLKVPSSPSFFRDMSRARLGDLQAMERLNRSQQDRPRVETRALGNTGAVGGSGGEMAPPLWLVDEFIALARPGRVFADLATKMPLPDGVSSINILRVLTGATTAIQSTQNTALSQTDLTTNAVTATIVTVGGKQVVSQQLLDQAGAPVDRLVLSDLAADYAKQLGLQFISGTGAGGQLRGVINGAGAVTVTFTTATPKVVDGTTPANSFLNTIVRAKIQLHTTRYMPATAVIMHPRRWGWVQEALDANGRPLITPEDADGDLNRLFRIEGVAAGASLPG